MPGCLSASTPSVSASPSLLSLFLFSFFTAAGWKQGSGRPWLMKYEKLGACLDYPRPLHLTRHNTVHCWEERHSSHTLWQETWKWDGLSSSLSLPPVHSEAACAVTSDLRVYKTLNPGAALILQFWSGYVDYYVNTHSFYNLSSCAQCIFLTIVSPASCVALGVAMSVHHFGPDWNLSTAVALIATKFGRYS